MAHEIVDKIITLYICNVITTPLNMLLNRIVCAGFAVKWKRKINNNCKMVPFIMFARSNFNEKGEFKNDIWWKYGRKIMKN